MLLLPFSVLCLIAAIQCSASKVQSQLQVSLQPNTFQAAAGPQNAAPSQRSKFSPQNSVAFSVFEDPLDWGQFEGLESTALTNEDAPRDACARQKRSKGQQQTMQSNRADSPQSAGVTARLSAPQTNESPATVGNESLATGAGGNGSVPMSFLDSFLRNFAQGAAAQAAAMGGSNWPSAWGLSGLSLLQIPNDSSDSGVHAADHSSPFTEVVRGAAGANSTDVKEKTQNKIAEEVIPWSFTSLKEHVGGAVATFFSKLDKRLSAADSALISDVYEFAL